eukprot:jgi/Mesvir1/2194/Mv16696-RA.3
MPVVMRAHAGPYRMVVHIYWCFISNGGPYRMVVHATLTCTCRNGTSLVRVRSGSGHGWYSCRSAPAAGSTTSNRCHLYDNRDGSRNKPLADWLFVGLTKKFNGTAIQSRPLAGPRNRKLYPSTLRGVCVKLQIQTAFIPVMSPKVLVGPPEDKGTGGSGGDKRNGWCVYAEVSPDSEA